MSDNTFTHEHVEICARAAYEGFNSTSVFPNMVPSWENLNACDRERWLVAACRTLDKFLDLPVITERFFGKTHDETT